MAEEALNDPFPDLKELENKTGRKIPESLLIWMRDAAECEDSWRSGEAERGEPGSAWDGLIHKIHNLKQEMRWLRSADVRILRQLVAVHEGIEAVRWLTEERGALASRGSSSTGSLSSLATVDEHGPWTSPCRESPSPGSDQGLTEATDEEPADQHPSHPDSGNSNHKRHSDLLRLNANLSRSRPEPLSSSSSKTLNMAGLQLDSDSAPLKSIGDEADVVRRALLRSSRSRRDEREDAAPGSLARDSGKPQAKRQTEDSFTTAQSSEDSDAAQCGVLLGYDAQWRWVESQDDVTFL
ncbi:leucine rich adaptor protein 1-like [Salarias fasciatus]|uniref:Leucine rich adaptor protein 1-like n=1 Tax=Salarias fasciatus TaxID=181472 RepID=A0A672FW86_SALFA|nr:leucine rich adaptor protein 1-like [Salarias fasciatus]